MPRLSPSRELSSRARIHRVTASESVSRRPVSESNHVISGQEEVAVAGYIRCPSSHCHRRIPVRARTKTTCGTGMWQWKSSLQDFLGAMLQEISEELALPEQHSPTLAASSQLNRTGTRNPHFRDRYPGSQDRDQPCAFAPGSHVRVFYHGRFRVPGAEAALRRSQWNHH